MELNINTAEHNFGLWMHRYDYADTATALVTLNICTSGEFSNWMMSHILAPFSQAAAPFMRLKPTLEISRLYTLPDGMVKKFTISRRVSRFIYRRSYQQPESQIIIPLIEVKREESHPNVNDHAKAFAVLHLVLHLALSAAEARKKL